MTVGFLPRVVVVPLLAAEDAVGAAAEVDTLPNLGLVSGDVDLASFFNPFALGDDGPWLAGF